MKIRLARNAFVRQYGEYTYVLNRVQAFDQVYKNASVFFRWITRKATDLDSVEALVLGFYGAEFAHEVQSDFRSFVRDMVSARIFIVGEDEMDMCRREEQFTYAVERPKTFETFIPGKSNGWTLTPQKLLDEYFETHPTIFRIVLDVTKACTERCVHCYIPGYEPTHLPLSTACRVLDEFREQGGVDVTVSGGECMLHPSFREIVQYARSRDLIVGILSNLTLCTDDMVSFLKKEEVTVQVSLYSMNPEVHDGITQFNGSWKKTHDAILKLHEADVACRIACPTMKENYRDYLSVLRFARTLKMDVQTDFIIMGKMDCDTSNLKHRLSLEETRCVLKDVVSGVIDVNREYFDPLKKTVESDEDWGARRVCGICENSICLDADGNYYPCPAFGGVVLGNADKNSLNWVWQHSPETLKIRMIRGKDFAKCMHCKDRNYCSICMCRNYNETGDMLSPAQHFCEVAKINHEVVDCYTRIGHDDL